MSVFFRAAAGAALVSLAMAATAGSLTTVPRDPLASDLRALGFTKVAPNATVPTLVRPDEAGFNFSYTPTFLGQTYAVDEVTGLGVADNGIPSWRPQDLGHVLMASDRTLLRDPTRLGSDGKNVLVGTLYQQAWRKQDGTMSFAYRLKLVDADDEGGVPDYQINYLRLVGYAPSKVQPYDVKVGWAMSARSGQFGFQAAAFTDVTASTGNAGEFYTSVSRCTTLAGCTGGIPVGSATSLRPLAGSQYRADTLNFRLDLEPLEGYSDTGWYIVDTNAPNYKRVHGNTTYLDGATAVVGGASNLVSFAVLGPTGTPVSPTRRTAAR